MATIFKRSGRSKWYIKYRDEAGQWKMVKGFRDKAATQAHARELERRAERVRAGLPVVQDEARRSHLGYHIENYLTDLVRRGSEAGGRHYEKSRAQLLAIADACGWRTLSDIHSQGLLSFLGQLNQAGRSARTQNHYLETLRAFLNWCVHFNYLPENPCRNVRPRRIGQRGRCRWRRAYTVAELGRLLAVTPEPRRTVYAVAAFSGFRRNELTLMEKQDCSPLALPPRWHVRGEIQKVDRAVNLPMLPECAKYLAPLWDSLRSPTDRLFRLSQTGLYRSAVPRVHTLVEDLARAGITRVDERGRVADFHSFRYTFCTLLSSRLMIQAVQRLMRHSTIALTANLYNDLNLTDTGEQLWTLPTILPPSDVSPGRQDADRAQEREEKEARRIDQGDDQERRRQCG